MSTGVDRYAYEVVAAIDQLAYEKEQQEQISIKILVPPGVKKLPEYQFIDVVRAKYSRFWTQGVFAIYCRAMRRIPINLCNEVSMLAPKGICALHDICYAEEAGNAFPKEEREWFLKIYGRICRHSKKIITVSQFSKERMIEKLGIPEEKILVAGNGWQHFQKVETKEEIFLRFPQIQKKEYYLIVSSANPNKNVQWIAANAERYPAQQYVLGGKHLDKIIDFSKHSNMVYVGFLNDVDMKSLMKECKAFVFPSFYEGFGIPPMEAMSAGAEAIVSTEASLPEVFGKSVRYINPYQSDQNLDELMEQKVLDAKLVLDAHSWQKSGEKILEMLQSI